MTTKEYLLKILEERKGELISGGEIAASLHLSRAAVWKAAQSLKASGYPITSLEHQGYRLENSSDILSEMSILPFLNPKELWDVHVFSSLSSTNLTARELATQNAPSGTVVVADQQTAGHGRLGRPFYSPAGSGIYMSILLRPKTDPNASLLITSAAAVAVCRAIEKVTSAHPQIKWVNDVYLDGKKLCGILTEASIDFETQTPEYVIIGIGINVKDTAFPPELSKIAVSLEQELSGEVSRSRLIAEILNETAHIMTDFPQKSFLEEYRRRSLLLGERINVISANDTIPGRAVAIDDLGGLVVEMDSGETKTLHSGEVSVRKI